MKNRSEAAEVFRVLEEFLARGQGGVVAMVVGVAGSAYRRPGARLLVGPGGRTWGGISAGCLEEDVRAHALAALEDGKTRLLSYDTSDISAIGLGLGCEGRVEVMVRPFSPSDHAVVHDIARALQSDLTISLVWEMDTDEPEIVVCRGRGEETLSVSPSPEVRLEVAASDAFAGEAPRLVSTERGRAFVECLHPLPRLVICGGGADSQPLAALARSVGFRVTILDHRPAHLLPEDFPRGTRLKKMRPDADAAARVFPRSSMVVVKTHSFELDLAWLKRVLQTEAAYIGLMGPRSRVLRLLEAVANDARVYGPVGLDLGATGAEQIAVSVVAELLAVRSDRVPRHLRNRPQPIHAA